MAAAEAGAAAKKALVKGGTLVVALTEGLRSMQEAGRLGDGELRRRRDLLSAARVEREGLEKLSNSMSSSFAGGHRDGAPSSSDKIMLLGSASSSGSRGGRVLGTPIQETSRTRELDHGGLLQLQKQVIHEQDQEVNALTSIVRRQKEMGLAIKGEVDRQVEMLTRLNEDVDRVEAKTKVANNRLKKMWLLEAILLLMVRLIILLTELLVWVSLLLTMALDAVAWLVEFGMYLAHGGDAGIINNGLFY
jgi:regulator of vacuolar morphogenesis